MTGVNPNIMKPLKSIKLIVLLSILISCSPDLVKIGSVNIISNRNININSGDYVLVSNYQGSSKQEMKKSKCKTIEEAIDATVKKVPGGEFLINAIIWKVNDEYFFVEGDVWGLPGKQGEVIETIKGFKVGDKVQYQKQMGTIISIIDSKECLVQLEGDNFGTKLTYEKIIKIDIGTTTTNNETINTNSDNTDLKTNNFVVGDRVKFLSKAYVPSESFIGKVISVSDSDKKLEVEYIRNGKSKTEKVSFYSIEGYQ